MAAPVPPASLAGVLLAGFRLPAVIRVIGRIPGSGAVPAGDGKVGVVVTAQLMIAIPVAGAVVAAMAAKVGGISGIVPFAVLVPVAVRRVPLAAAFAPGLGAFLRDGSNAYSAAKLHGWQKHEVSGNGPDDNDPNTTTWLVTDLAEVPFLLIVTSVSKGSDLQGNLRS